MNVPILTVEGNFHHERIEYPVIVFKIIDEVCKMPDTRPYSFLSAVEHEATAIAVNAVVGKFSFISKVEVNRILYRYV